ncbi:TPA: hypothetical protein ACH3X2_005399 [Trebouxia sp. C0005]
MNSVNNSLRAAKDTMMPAALRRKLDSPASKKQGNAAGLAALTKEEPPAVTQTIVANTAPVLVNDSKAAAPQRPPPRPSEAGTVPQLNRYVRSQLPKGESGTYHDLIRALGESRNVGEKGHKTLLELVLPRLAQYEVVPATLVAQLLQIIGTTDDKKVVRQVYYLLQVLLGVGSAGTPSPTPGSSNASAALDLPPDVVARAWADIAKPSEVAKQRLALRALAAAARGTDGEKAVLQAIDTALARASQVEPAFAPEKKKKNKGNILDESYELQRSAFMAARAALKGPAAQLVAFKCFGGIVNLDPIGARHALALTVVAARKDAGKVLSEQAELAPLINSAVAQYEASGLLIGQSKPAAADKLQTMTSKINLTDKWARIHLARLCSALVYAEWTSTQTFVSGLGAPMWRMLVMLATRDQDDLVTVEAIKALFGQLPPYNPSLMTGATALTPQEELVSNRMRIRAWSMVSSQAAAEVVYIPGLQGAESATLMGAVGVRLRAALRSPSAPLICSAARAAGAMVEAHARAVAASVVPRATKGIPGRTMDMITQELIFVLEGSDGAAERCAAMESLFWLQALPSQATIVSPAALLRHVSSTRAIQQEGGGSVEEPWNQDLLQALLAAIYKVLRAVPKGARLLLECAGAVVAAAPSKFKGDQLAGMWSAALPLGLEGKMAALQAALEFIGTPPPPVASARTGATVSGIGKAAAEEAAWAKLQRSAVWWLGEHANAAALEYAGDSEAVKATAAVNAAMKMTTSPGEIIAMQALRKPLMAAVLSHLHHSALSQPWGIRVAAVQAIAKVAVRSEEPYKLQGYTILKSLSAPDYISDPDATGVASAVLPAVKILDAIYSTRITLEGLATRYGMKHEEWPEAVLESLKARHNQIYSQIEDQICSLGGAYHPLGPKSKALMSGIGLEELNELAKPPEPQQPEAEAQRDSVFAKEDQAKKDAYDESDDESAISRTESELREVTKVLQEQPPTPRQEEQFAPLPPLDLGSLGSLDALQQELDAKVVASYAPVPKPYRPWEDITPSNAGYEEEEEDYGYPSHMRQASLELNVTEVASPRGSSEMIVINGRGIVQYNFEATVDEELTVDRGEQVEVAHEIDGWLQVANIHGEVGLVPSSFVRILQPGEVTPAAVGTAGAALSSAVSTGVEGLSGRRGMDDGYTYGMQPSSARASVASSEGYGPNRASRSTHEDAFGGGDPLESWKDTDSKGWGNNSWGRSPQASAAAPRSELNAFASQQLDFDLEEEAPPAYGDAFAARPDAEPRLQTAQSAQPPEVGTAVSDTPILSQTPASPSRSPAAPTPAYQPTRFASEAATEASQAAEAGNGDAGQRQGDPQQEFVAPVARGLSDTPWLSDAEPQAAALAQPERLSVTHAPERELAAQLPRQEFVSQQSLGASSTGFNNGGFVGRAGRLSKEPQGGPFQRQPQSPAGRVEQEPQGRAFGQQPQAAEGRLQGQPQSNSSAFANGSQSFEAEQQNLGGRQQVSNTPILGGPAAVPQQQQPVSTTKASVPQQPPQQLPQQVQQQPPQSAFSRFDSFGTQYDDGSPSMQPQRLPSTALGPARSIPEGAPIVFEDTGLPKLGPISAHRHRRTMSSELNMTPRRAPESPMGNVSPSLGSPASENKPKPWPGLVLYGFEAESEEEVSVYPGDEIIVHQEVEGWFQITRVADQTRGLVPASYVQITS